MQLPVCRAAWCVRASLSGISTRRLALGHTVYARDLASRTQLVARLHAWRALGLSMFLLSFYGSVVSYGIKGMWGRARPFMVLPAECQAVTCGYPNWPNETSKSCLDYTGPATNDPQYNCAFTGWWHPNGYRTHLTSFPSGHTFEGWLLLPLALHFTEMPHASAPPPGAKIAVWVAVIGWGTMVGSSRVVLGAVCSNPNPRLLCAKRDSRATDLDLAVLQHWSSDTVMSDFATWALAVFLWRRHPPMAPQPTDSSESLVPGVASEKDEQQTL